MHEQQIEHCGGVEWTDVVGGAKIDRQASLREDGTQSLRLFVLGSQGVTRTVRQSAKINDIN